MKSQSEHTPGIVYLSGSDLLAHDERWYTEVETVTRGEVHLLTKTRTELEPAARQGLVTIAIDTTQDNRLVGCIVLWPLCDEEHVSSSAGPSLSIDRLNLGEAELRPLQVQPSSARWYELGTFLVVPDHRFKARGPRALPIGDVLTRHLLDEHADKRIMCTTTNPAAAHTFVRDEMRVVSFHALPMTVHLATCICPLKKTGVADNQFCRIKNGPCYAFISHNTWESMGCPATLPLTF